MKNKVLLFLTLGLFIVACVKKDEKTVYYPTQTGEDILYCKLYGKERIYRSKTSSGSLFGIDGLTARVLERVNGGSLIQLSASERIRGSGQDYFDDDIYINVDIGAKTVAETQPELHKKYMMYLGIGGDSKYIIKGQPNLITYEYLIDTTASYVYFTRFDDIVMSGSFHFEAHYKDSLHITATDGFFDILR